MMEISETIVTTFKTTECCVCGVRFAMASELYDNRLRDHKSFYCPNGHSQQFTDESAEEKLRRERDRLAQQISQKNDEILEARAEAEKQRKKPSALSGAPLRGHAHVAIVHFLFSNSICPLNIPISLPKIWAPRTSLSSKRSGRDRAA